MTIYSNANTMVRDILGYLRVCPDANIIPADDPGRQMVGYVAWSACRSCRAEQPAITWEIPLSLVRYPPDNVRWSVLRDYLQGNARNSFIADLRRQATEDTMTAEEALERSTRWANRPVVTDTEELQKVAEAAAKKASSMQRVVRPMAPFRHAPFWEHEICTEYSGTLEPGTIVTIIQKDNEVFSKVALPDGRAVTMSNSDLEEPDAEPNPPITRYDRLGEDE